MIYLGVVVLVLVMIIRYDINGLKRNKDFCYNIVLLALILIAGLRYRLGADTTIYLYNFYHTIPELGNLKPDFWNWDEEPLFNLINSIVKTLGGRFYIVQFIEAIFVNVLLFRYVKKHSDYIFTCVFFYIIWMFTFYNMEEMRASMALVVCLFANDYILEKKWIKGFLLFVVAGLFHKTAFIVLLVSPFLLFLRKSIVYGCLFVGVAFLLGIIVQKNFGDYIYILDLSQTASEDMEQYMKMTGQLDQEGNNLNFFIVNIFPFLVYPLFALLYIKRHNDKSRILQLQPLLFVGLTFVAVQASMQLAYRFVHFYAIYLIMFIAEMLIGIVKNENITKKGKPSVWSYCKSFVLLLPLLVVLIRAQMDTYVRYFPYSSVIERSVNKDREKEFDHAAKYYEY